MRVRGPNPRILALSYPQVANDAGWQRVGRFEALQRERTLNRLCRSLSRRGRV